MAVCNSTDLTLFSSDWSTTPATGYDRLSRGDSTTLVDNRVGYAGYQWEPVIKLFYLRNRWLNPHTGTFTTRDPLGYVDGMGLYVYARNKPVDLTDPSGLCPPPELASPPFQSTGFLSRSYTYLLYRWQWNWSVPIGVKKRVEPPIRLDPIDPFTA